MDLKSIKLTVYVRQYATTGDRVITVVRSETLIQALIIPQVIQDEIKMKCLGKFLKFLYLLTMFLATPIDHCLHLCVSSEAGIVLL